MLMLLSRGRDRCRPCGRRCRARVGRRSCRNLNSWLALAGGVQAKSSGAQDVFGLLYLPLSGSHRSEDQICSGARMYLARERVDSGWHRLLNSWKNSYHYSSGSTGTSRYTGLARFHSMAACYRSTRLRAKRLPVRAARREFARSEHFKVVLPPSSCECPTCPTIASRRTCRCGGGCACSAAMNSTSGARKRWRRWGCSSQVRRGD